MSHCSRVPHLLDCALSIQLVTDSTGDDTDPIDFLNLCHMHCTIVFVTVFFLSCLSSAVLYSITASLFLLQSSFFLKFKCETLLHCGKAMGGLKLIVYRPFWKIETTTFQDSLAVQCLNTLRN